MRNNKVECHDLKITAGMLAAFCFPCQGLDVHVHTYKGPEASTPTPAYLVSLRSYGCHPNAHADIFTLLMVKCKLLNVLVTKRDM